MTQMMSVTDVKARLSELVAMVEETHDRIEITRNGQVAAVLISPNDLGGLEETVAVLNEPETMAGIEAGLAAAEAGDVVSGEEFHQAMMAKRMDLGA